jgi:outer membrane lipoprotein-sorting protein
MWNWVPTIDRLIKIPPSMMLQSWMGSDFTNDDLTKQSSIVTDYKQTLLAKETLREQECYKIELIPNPDASVVWGKLITWITVSGFNTWKTEFYDEDMKLVSVQTLSDIRHMGDRDIPTRIEIEPVNKKGNKTVLEILKMSFNQPLSDDYFSQQNMKSLK